MIPDDILDAVIIQINQAESRLLEMMGEGRVGQEPDMTSRLVHGVELATDEVPDVDIRFTIVDGIGPGAAERTLGADVIGVVRVELGEVRVAKGFLAQAKRSGKDGVHLAAATSSDYSHWLYRGEEQQLDQSGVVSIGRPSSRLDEQCENMLRLTPASYVFVFGESQVGVVSASAVHSRRSSSARPRSRLGTKRLDDFFVHILDCFIGDPSIAVSSVAELTTLAAQRGAAAALMLRVSDRVPTGRDEPDS